MIDRQPYPVLRSKVDRASSVYQANRQACLAQLEKLAKALAKASDGGGEKYIAAPPRSAASSCRASASSCCSTATATSSSCARSPGHDIVRPPPGRQRDRRRRRRVAASSALITASEPTVKGGAISELGVQKSARLAEIAAQNRLPSINLTESAGADLPNQSKIFVPGGRGFRELTRRCEAAHRRRVCLVFGSSTAGGAYIPGMSDYVVMVKEQAQVYLAGPPLVKMATGEDTDHEALGGAEMHSRVSGVSDYLARRRARRHPPRARDRRPPRLAQGTGPRRAREVEPPRYDPEELLGIASRRRARCRSTCAR